MNIVNITVGVVTTAVKSGLNALKGQFSSLRKFANGELAGALVGGGLIATFDKIIEKAGQIADTSARFGLVPESLQEITNAAEPNGATMEDVAAAMNKTAISQEKVRKGNKELRETLQGLKIDTDAFINASPEEAFFMISDAVKGAEDRTMAYGAVVDLMGKSSGKLFTTIEQGSAAIKEQGRAVGVMSNDAVARLDELGDTFTNLKNTLFAWGAEALSFTTKLIQSVGAIIGAEVLMVKDFFEYAKGGFKGNFADSVLKNSSEAGKAQLQEIWSPKKQEEQSGKKSRTAEDLESEIADRTKLQALYDKIDEKKLAMQAKEKDGEGQILELMRQRNYLNEEAEGATDLQKQAELWDKALDIQKEIMTLREKADADEEKRIERIAQKRSDLEDKSLSLEERRAKLQEKLKGESDEEKKIDLQSDLFDVEKQIKDKNKGASVSTLQKIGGGGAAFAKSSDPNDRMVRAVNDAKNETMKARVLLEKIEKKTGKSTWNP